MIKAQADSDYFDITTTKLEQIGRIDSNEDVESNVETSGGDEEEEGNRNDDTNSDAQVSNEDETQFVDRIFQSYCRISINDMVIPLSQDDLNDQVLKVSYKDDIMYECEFPEYSIKSNHTWFINEQKVDTVDSQVNVVIDKSTFKNGSRLQVKCHIISSKNEKIEIKFPLLEVDAYVFSKHEMSAVSYLMKYKYKTVLNILIVNFFITVVAAGLFLISSFVAFYRAKHVRNKQKLAVYEPVRS